LFPYLDSFCVTLCKDDIKRESIARVLQLRAAENAPLSISLCLRVDESNTDSPIDCTQSHAGIYGNARLSLDSIVYAAHTPRMIIFSCDNRSYLPYMRAQKG